MLQVPELLRIKSLVPPNSNRYMHPIPENLKNVFSIISCNALFHFKVCISHLELNNLTKTYDTFRLIFQAQCPQLPLKKPRLKEQILALISSLVAGRVAETSIG
jgi:hypothetical protein